jgi:nicotinate-nucleotide pyrophosphorylase (carboxylating)
MMTIPNLDELILSALREDIGDGDHSTLACIPSDYQGKAQMVAKAEGIICGIEVGKRVFELVDHNTRVTTLLKDGDRIKKGDLIMIVEGASGSILTAERTALNFM